MLALAQQDTQEEIAKFKFHAVYHHVKIMELVQIRLIFYPITVAVLNLTQEQTAKSPSPANSTNSAKTIQHARIFKIFRIIHVTAILPDLFLTWAKTVTLSFHAVLRHVKMMQSVKMK